MNRLQLLLQMEACTCFDQLVATLSHDGCRSIDVKQLQSDHAAMQEQLELAEAKAKAAEARCSELEQGSVLHQQQKQQLVAACQPVLAWVSLQAADMILHYTYYVVEPVAI